LYIIADCAWSDYSVWSICSKTCGEGTQSRAGYVQRLAVNGGKNCTGEPEEITSCAKDLCPGNESQFFFNYINNYMRDSSYKVIYFFVIRFFFHFCAQLTVNGTTLEIGVHAVRIVVVDGKENLEQ
jgi:hypothetical protein